jgi:hypothetical protein
MLWLLSLIPKQWAVPILRLLNLDAHIATDRPAKIRVCHREQHVVVFPSGSVGRGLALTIVSDGIVNA